MNVKIIEKMIFDKIKGNYEFSNITLFCNELDIKLDKAIESKTLAFTRYYLDNYPEPSSIDIIFIHNNITNTYNFKITKIGKRKFNIYLGGIYND